MRAGTGRRREMARGTDREDMALGTGADGRGDMALGTGANGRGDMALGTGRRARAARLAGWAALVMLACEATPTPGPAGPETPAPTAPAPAPEAAPVVVHPLLPWLDPDSGSALYSRIDPKVDLEALGRLFAVPPRAGHMLRDVMALRAGLAALMDGVGPAPETWLRDEVLAYLPPLAHGPYMVFGLQRPRAEVEGLLRAGGLHAEVREGMTTYSPLPGGEAPAGPAEALPTHHAPMAAFPWRIVFLEDDVIGCVSLREIGGGLAPLTAARDLPASELEVNLSRSFADDGEMLMDMVASGPMLSLDISDDVGAIRLGVRRWERTGIDGELILQPLGDPDAAVKQLEERRPTLETDVVRELYERIAFTPEAPVVRGRMQLAEADLRLLRVSEGG